VWFVTSEFFGITFSVIFCAIAIKLADDFLDQDIDKNQNNFSKILENGIMLYGMLAMVIAVSFNASISIPLFLSSYIIGMFHDLKNPFPSHLSGLQESIIVLIIGVLFWGLEAMMFSIVFVMSVQLLDDYIDVKTDQLTGHRNWAHRLGKVECFLLFLLSILTAYMINERWFPPVFFGLVVFYGTLLYYQRRKL
jgi:hypothetical protein